MNNIERARKYTSLEWNEEQESLLNDIFEKIDYLLLTCEKERNIQKIESLMYTHQNIHDIVLAMTLDKMLEKR